MSPLPMPGSHNLENFAYLCPDNISNFVKWCREEIKFEPSPFQIERVSRQNGHTTILLMKLLYDIKFADYTYNLFYTNNSPYETINDFSKIFKSNDLIIENKLDLDEKLNSTPIIYYKHSIIIVIFLDQKVFEDIYYIDFIPNHLKGYINLLRLKLGNVIFDI